MTTAKLTVLHAGPQITLQDQGRYGLLRYGVPASGPMDRFAFAIANLALGNPAGQTAIEVSQGGLTLYCTHGPISFAVAGGNFRASIDQIPLSAWCVASLHSGETLTLQWGRWGSWCYLALAGNLNCPQWLGSASTHGPSGLGGGVLMTGDSLQIKAAEHRPDRHATLVCPVSARPRHNVRVTLGPQDRFFDAETRRAFLTQTFTLSDACDRMGVRLAGPALHLNAPLDMPSEAICRGAIQVAGDGVATVLLADHQTTGGYPKIATVLSDDLDGFVQLRSHQTVQFEAIAAQDATMITRLRDTSKQRYLAQITQSLTGNM